MSMSGTPEMCRRDRPYEELSVRLRAGDTLSEAAEYFCVTEDFLRKACELYRNMGKTFAGTEGESV